MLASSASSAWPDSYLQSVCQLASFRVRSKTCLPVDAMEEEDEAPEQTNGPDPSLHGDCRAVSTAGVVCFEAKGIKRGRSDQCEF